MSSAIIGATRPEHGVENVKAADMVLNADVPERIEAILSGQRPGDNLDSAGREILVGESPSMFSVWP